MTRTELATEAWSAWIKDKPLQSEDTEKGFREGFNFCLLGKIKVEGGDKGELISANFLLRDRLTKAAELLKWALHSDPEHDDLGEFDNKWKEAEQFLKEVEA
jgi:hypothetical protein